MSDKKDCTEGRARRRGEKDWPLAVRSLIFYNIQRNSGEYCNCDLTPRSFRLPGGIPTSGATAKRRNPAFMGLSQRTKNRLGFFCHYMQ